MAHYNQKELNVSLKNYLYVHVKEYKDRIVHENKTFLSPKLTDENRLRAECNIEVYTHRLNFYQTQLDNLL